MIGVFDSGFGGMTVLAGMRELLPDQQFVYLGDHANAPYGTQPPARVYELTRRGVEELFLRGCHLVILACNTASTVALRRLQEEYLPVHWPLRRVLGVVVPTIEAITGSAWHEPGTQGAGHRRTVAIFATQATVDSGYFSLEIARRGPGVRVLQQACPELAGMIEAGAGTAELAGEIDRAALSLRQQLAGDPLDLVVLGCTHYALVETLFQAALAPAAPPLLSQARETAAALRRYLQRHPRFLTAAAMPRNEALVPPPDLLTTGEAGAVSARGARFLDPRQVFAAVRQGSH